MTYAATVLADSPTFYWRFGEASGASTGIDSSPNGHDLFYFGAPTTGVPGLLGGDADTAVQFSDSSGNIVVGNGTSVPAGTYPNWSMEAIWQPITVSSGFQSIFEINDGGAEYIWIYQSNGAIQGAMSGTSNVYSTGLYPVVAGQIYHLVLTFNGTRLKLYMNGALVENTAHTDAGTIFSNAKGYVGDQNGGGLPANGVIDECAFYLGSALSAARVTAHFTAAAIPVNASPSPSRVSAVTTIGGVRAGQVTLVTPAAVNAAVAVATAQAGKGPIQGNPVNAAVTIPAPLVFQEFDTWRPRLSPDLMRVLVSRTDPGEHDTDLTHMTLWTFDPDGFDGASPTAHSLHQVKTIPSTYGWVSYGHPEWSADSSLVVICVETTTDWIIQTLHGTDFTNASVIYDVAKPALVADPSFLADGSVIFVEKSGSTYSISKMSAAATPVHSQLVTSTNLLADPVVDPTGSVILYGERTNAPDGGHAYGQWKLNTIPVTGGSPTVVRASSDASLHPTWQTEGTILFQLFRYGTDTKMQVARISRSGSSLTVFGEGEYPQAVKI